MKKIKESGGLAAGIEAIFKFAELMSQSKLQKFIDEFADSLGKFSAAEFQEKIRELLATHLNQGNSSYDMNNS